MQAKLLRVLETGEVFALGASRPTRVDVCLCTATREDLRHRVAEGGFRGTSRTFTRNRAMAPQNQAACSQPCVPR